MYDNRILFDNHWLASHLTSQGNGNVAAAHLEVVGAWPLWVSKGNAVLGQSDGAPLLGIKYSFVYLPIQPALATLKIDKGTK